MERLLKPVYVASDMPQTFVENFKEFTESPGKIAPLSFNERGPGEHLTGPQAS